MRLTEGLEQERQWQIKKMDQWRDYQLACAEAAYRLETEQAEQDYKVRIIFHVRAKFNPAIGGKIRFT